jgi:fatty-acyl-CoA synthase
MVNVQPSVDWLAKRARLSPNRVALIDAVTGEQVTYAEWNRRANRVANALHALGVVKGDIVGILASNSLAYLDLLFACQKSGIILQTLNCRLATEELVELLQRVTPRILIHGSQFCQRIPGIAEKIDLQHVIALDELAQGYSLRWNDWIAQAATTPPNPVPLTMNDPWVLCYTGGTTGLPKAATLTHGNITWNAINTVASWELTSDDVTFLNAPLFHTGGINVFTAPLVHAGGCSIVCKSFDPDQVFDLVRNRGVTIFFGVPTMFIVMQQHEQWDRMDFSMCKTVLSGGAPCPAPVFERFFEKGVPFETGYGLTEAGPNNFWLPNEDAQHKMGSVGFPLFHVDVRIINSEGQPCEPEEMGELLIRGPHVVPGYWNDAEATAKAIINGWLHTGDLARYDDEGYIYVVGRSKDMIISGGENIYPAVVESVILGHAAVAEACLIGVPDTKWGEVGRAIVVRRHGMPLAEEELLDYMRSRMASFKVPKSVVFTDTLPKTAAGKIDKRLLLQHYGGDV